MAVVGALIVAPLVQAALDVADLLLGGVLVADDADPAVAFRRHGHRLRRCARQVVDAPGRADLAGAGGRLHPDRALLRGRRADRLARHHHLGVALAGAGVVGGRGQEAVVELRRRQARRDHRRAAIAALAAGDCDAAVPAHGLGGAGAERQKRQEGDGRQSLRCKRHVQIPRFGVTHFGAGRVFGQGKSISRAKRAGGCIGWTIFTVHRGDKLTACGRRGALGWTGRVLTDRPDAHLGHRRLEAVSCAERGWRPFSGDVGKAHPAIFAPFGAPGISSARE